MRAPQPEPPIPGSFATPSLLAWIVNGKYVMSLPLYRIETDLKACGATISRQDMANWMMNVHARWLAKVHERMKVELLSHVRIHADETTVQVLKEPNREAKKKSRMWLFCSARCDVPVYVFEYHETRRKGVAQEFLAGWSGTLTTDGYKPYFNLGNPNIANTACLVHVRRYFAQIVKIAGGGAKAASAASVACISSSRCFVFSHVFFSGLGSCMHFPYFSGCAEVFLPNMRASLTRRLWPVNSRSRPWCTMRSMIAAASLSSAKTVPHLLNSMFVVNMMLRLS